MKKTIMIFSTALFFAVSANAQVKPSANSGGLILKGGVNFANISITKNGNVDDANSLTSFHAGLVADLPLSDGLWLQPGLLLTGKGSKTLQGTTNDRSYYKATSNPLYVELPVNLVGKIPLGTSNLFIGAGPYVAMGVKGKNKTEGKIFGVAFNNEYDIKYSNDDPTTSYEENAGYGQLKKFDYGLNALAGLDFGKFMLSANYGLGLVKINSGASNKADDSNKHRVVSVSVGVKL